MTRITLTHGELLAQIAAEGAALHALRIGDRDLIVPFDPATGLPAYGGALLAPWPNRVVDGRYGFPSPVDGPRIPHQLAITEPARHHALHGLVVHAPFDIIEQSAAAVTLRAEIRDEPGYPWHLIVTTCYELGPAGLTQTVRATNASDAPAPFGTGHHPYLRAGDTPLDSWELELRAAQVQLTTGARMLPGEVVAVSVDPSRFDFRSPRPIGNAQIDHAFTDLNPDANQRMRAALRASDGHGVEMSWDAGCPWVQLCTADTHATDTSRAGLAVEPMTCPPDAFNSGVDLARIAPGDSTEVSWSIAPL